MQAQHLSKPVLSKAVVHIHHTEHVHLINNQAVQLSLLLLKELSLQELHDTSAKK